MTDWSHPRIQNPDSGKYCWAEMAREATAALWRRRDSYPQLVNTGKMDKADAAQDIAAWEAIAADWDWICTGLGEPAGRDTLEIRVEALDTALFRFFQVIDRHYGAMSQVQSQQGALLAAMRWWMEREGSGHDPRHPRFCASIGHTWRAENGYPPLGEVSINQSTEERKAG